MTVIAIKDGLLAHDTMATSNELIFGIADKSIHVIDKENPHGTGHYAGAGDLGWVSACFKNILEGNPIPSGTQAVIVRMDDDGEVYLSEFGQDFYHIHAQFVAIGTGDELAMGAMAMGADARKAVEIAIENCISCGGPIVSYRAKNAKAAEKE